MMEPSKQSTPPTIQHARSRRWIKRAFIFLVLGVALWGVVVAAMPRPVEVEVTDVSSGPFVVTVNEDGVSRIRDRYVISAPLAGTLARLEMHPGDEVEQGRILARILPLNAPLRPLEVEEEELGADGRGPLVHPLHQRGDGRIAPDQCAD